MNNNKLLYLISILIGFSQPVAAKSDVVFLLHGIGRSSNSMSKIEKALIKDGYEVHNIDYPSTKNSIEELAQMAFTEIEKKLEGDNKSIHFVTHSMGGILVRYYLHNNPFPPVSRMVMLAPPNKGSQVADGLRNWDLYESLMGPAGQQLGTTNRDIYRTLPPPHFDVGVIAGNRSLNPIFSGMLPGDDDGAVTVENTKLAAMRDFIVLPVTHTFIMRNTDVIHQVRLFLKNGRFDSSKIKKRHQK